MKGDLADRGKDHIQMTEHNQDYSEDGKWSEDRKWSEVMECDGKWRDVTGGDGVPWYVGARWEKKWWNLGRKCRVKYGTRHWNNVCFLCQVELAHHEARNFVAQSTFSPGLLNILWTPANAPGLWLWTCLSHSLLCSWQACVGWTLSLWQPTIILKWFYAIPVGICGFFSDQIQSEWPEPVGIWLEILALSQIGKKSEQIPISSAWIQWVTGKTSKYPAVSTSIAGWDAARPLYDVFHK